MYLLIVTNFILLGSPYFVLVLCKKCVIFFPTAKFNILKQYLRSRYCLKMQCNEVRLYYLGFISEFPRVTSHFIRSIISNIVLSNSFSSRECCVAQETSMMCYRIIIETHYLQLIPDNCTDHLVEPLQHLLGSPSTKYPGYVSVHLSPQLQWNCGGSTTVSRSKAKI